jgi:hypothetical protein
MVVNSEFGCGRKWLWYNLRLLWNFPEGTVENHEYPESL